MACLGAKADAPAQGRPGYKPIALPSQAKHSYNHNASYNAGGLRISTSCDTCS